MPTNGYGYKFVETMDAEEMSDFFSGEEGIARFRPLKGSDPIQAYLSHHTLPKLTFWEDRYPHGVQIEVGTAIRTITLSLPLTGSGNVHAGADSIHVSANCGMITNGDTINRFQAGVGYYQRLFAIPEASLIRALSAHIGDAVNKPLTFQHGIDMRQTTGMMLRNFGQMFSDGLITSQMLYDSPIAAANISDAMMATLMTAVPHSLSHLYDRPVYVGNSWQMQRAIDYLVANASLPLTAEDIASACNLSVSSLYKMFKEQRGTTPKLLLRQIRLKGARRDILSPDFEGPISQIGQKWGFLNLGDFAALYKKAFGELPSQTARKRR